MAELLKTKRVYLEGDELEEEMIVGLFWVKGGRVFCFHGAVVGDEVARVYRLIQEFYPLVEIDGVHDVSMLEDAEECVQLEKGGKIVSVRQIGRVKIGNVHLLIKRLLEV